MTHDSTMDGRLEFQQTGSPSGHARATSVVCEQLESARSTSFCPPSQRWSRWKDRKKKIDWPAVPGYCFARFDPDNTLPILKVTGVVTIISFDGKPAPIPEREIDSIRRPGRQRAAVRPVPAAPRGPRSK